MKFWQVLGNAFGFEESAIKQTQPQEKQNESINLLDTKISILKPVTFKDITRFVQILRQNQPLIVNFNNLNSNEAERSLDFVCGAVCALNGKLERIGQGIYFYAPKGLRVESEKRHKGRSYAN